MKPGKTAITLGALVLLLGIGILSLPPQGPTTCPDISLVTADGEKLDLGNLRGQPLLVTFWSTTCSTCIREMPHLAELHRELGPRGLEVIGIAMYYDPPNQVLAMRKAKNIPYTIALDMGAEAAQAFGEISVTPSSFLIAPDGRIVYRQAGMLSMDLVKKRILALLDSEMAANQAHPGVPDS